MLTHLRAASRLISLGGIATIISACGGDGTNLDANGQLLSDDNQPRMDALDGTYAAVRQILDANCVECHQGPSANAGLDLSDINNLINVPSRGRDQYNYITPGNADDSYLVRKVRALPSDGIAGSQMPLGQPPLDQDDIETIVTWIDAGAPKAVTEVVAQVTDFSDYATWDVIDYSIGDTNEKLFATHQGPDPLNEPDSHARRVFANPTAVPNINGEYPIGSIFVKEIVTYKNDTTPNTRTIAALVAMVKRSANFGEDDPDNRFANGWEWFVLNNDASGIALRGVNLDGAPNCTACHNEANRDELDANGNDLGRDFVFTHESEFIATSDTFNGYQGWDVIDDRSDDNFLLGGGAHLSSGPTRRIVYKKQFFAAPEGEEGNENFPIGTVLVKEIMADDGGEEVVAMVKRGGEFNPQSRNWEWFELNTDGSGTILQDNDGNDRRGENLNNGGCTGCHSAAIGVNGAGRDFVFFHPDDPFNQKPAE